MSRRPQDALSFSAPPVKTTTLGIDFESSKYIQAMHIAKLHDKWESYYASVEEDVPNPDLARSLSADGGPYWPIPVTKYVTKDENRIILFRNNRFEIQWRFARGEEYPGFDALASELKSRLEDFCSVLWEAAEILVTLTGSDCRYENEMPGETGSSLALGVLTEWASENPHDELDAMRDYVGIRIRHGDDFSTGTCLAVISVDAESSEVIPTLSIDVGRLLLESEQFPGANGESGVNSVVPLGGLMECHERLIELFIRYTNETQRSEWGVNEA